jgi:broad specificity phosphatase PhoE
MTFYLFRHGLTQAVKDGQNYGESVKTAEILEEGKPAIERMAGYLKNVEDSANYCSDYLRCRQTVAIIEEITKKKFKIDPRLGEFSSETGEERSSLVERLNSFYREVSELPVKNVVVCTHAEVIMSLVSLITQGQAEPFWETIPQVGQII